jgi:hypothetical protein
LNALALKVDDVVWWLALTDEDLAKVVDDAVALPQLGPAAMRESVSALATAHRLLIDSYVSYELWESVPHQPVRSEGRAGGLVFACGIPPLPTRCCMCRSLVLVQASLDPT